MSELSRRALLGAAGLAALSWVDAGCSSTGRSVASTSSSAPSTAASTAASGSTASTMTARIIPEPVLVQPAADGYSLGPDTVIYTQPGSAPAAQLGGYVAELLRPSTGFALPVRSAGGGAGISLLLSGASPSVGAEGYELDVTGSGITIRAQQPAGLFAGVQTLRQLLPAAAGGTTHEPGPWPVPGGHILDYPRYEYRGSMLDVARHFFSVPEVERYIDDIALYKFNYLHLHLTDDQGWRIEIDGWPKLTSVGGASEVGGTAGGFFTQAEYKEIVAYAQSRYVTIVPEVDMPSHVDAALSAYPELGGLSKAPAAYTSIHVPGSTLTAGAPTDRFIDAVISQLGAITPGPYFHIGGDEARNTSAEVYSAVMGRAQGDAVAARKIPIGWDEAADAELDPNTILEYWHTPGEPATAGFTTAVQRGARVIMAPANHAYLDQKYTKSEKLGLDWAGFVEVRDAYDWDPATVLPGVPASAVVGVEAPLWTETLSTMEELEYMAFPRLLAIAEIGWSPQATHDWTGFAARLGAQAPLWAALGIDYYKSPEVSWAA